MKRIIVATVLASVLVTGCGGGGSSSAGNPAGSTSSSTPAPTTPTAPEPAPPATQQPATLLTSPVGAILPGYAGVRSFERNADGVLSVGFSYGAAYGTRATVAGAGVFSYQIRSEFFGGTAPPAGTFGLTREASSDQSRSFYSATAGGRVFRVEQLNVGSSNPLLGLQYSTLAVATITNPDASTGKDGYAVSPMVFGIPFDTASTRLRGMAVYNGVIAGIASAGQLEGVATPLGSKTIYNLSGTIKMQMNFDSATFTGEVHLVGTDDRSKQTADLGTFAIQGTIPDPTTSSSIFGSTPGGTLQATLAGPAAEEIEVTFEAQVADPNTPNNYLKVLAVAAAKK